MLGAGYPASIGAGVERAEPMSRFSGPQGRGALKRLRESRMWEAYRRQVAYRHRKGNAAIEAIEMLPARLRGETPEPSRG